MDAAEKYARAIMDSVEKSQDATVISWMEQILTNAFRAGAAHGAASQGVLSSDKETIHLG